MTTGPKNRGIPLLLEEVKTVCESDQQDRNIGYEQYYLGRHAPNQKNYDRKSNSYERKLGKELHGHSIQSSLDVGCGSGFLVNYLLRRGAKRVVGVDKCSSLLEVAKDNVPGGIFLETDILDYVKHCNEKFDAIFLMNILEHIPRESIVDILRDIRKLLNDSGIILVRTPNWNNIVGPGHFADDLTHQTPFTDQSLEQAAKQAGFARIEFCNQYRMQKFSGKLRMIVSWIIHRTMFKIRGGRMPQVFHRNIYAKLFV